MHAYRLAFPSYVHINSRVWAQGRRSTCWMPASLIVHNGAFICPLSSHTAEQAISQIEVRPGGNELDEMHGLIAQWLAGNCSTAVACKIAMLAATETITGQVAMTVRTWLLL